MPEICYDSVMPTKLFTEEKYITPDEFIDFLQNHFDQLPADKLFMPMVAYTSCDSQNRETVIVNTKTRRVLAGICMTLKNKKYGDFLRMKTIVRDKSKAN